MTLQRHMALAVVLGGLSLAACGGPSATSPPKPSPTASAGGQRAMLDAFTVTKAAKSAKFSMVASATTSGMAATVDATGAMSTVDKTAQATLVVPGGNRIQERVLGTQVFLDLPPALSARLGAKTPWVMIDSAKLPQGASSFSGYQGSAQAQQSLAMLKQVSTSGIHEVGHAKVRGTATTEYQASVDLAKMAPPGAGSNSFAAQLAAAHVKTVPIHVWVDAQGRVRQMAMTMTMTPPSTGSPAQASGSMTLTLLIDLYDFGTPVQVTPPPPSQVTDVTAHIAAMTSSARGSQG